MKKLTSALVLLAASAPMDGEAAICPGFEGGSASQIDADRFYVERALDVMRAAARKDTDALRTVVAEEARFEIWRGDYTTSARRIGPDGAVEMVQDVKPIRFEAQSVAMGPIEFVPDGCSWAVDLLFRTDQPLEGVRVRFSFRDGKLISAVGNAVQLIEGEFR